MCEGDNNSSKYINLVFILSWGIVKKRLNMKKIILLLFPLLLVGCSPTNNSYSTYLFNKADAQIDDTYFGTTNVSSTQIKYMIDSNSSFSLYFYSTTCSHCVTAKETIKSYINEYHQLIYSMEYSASGYQSLVNEYPNIFDSVLFTPSLIIIKEKKLTYTFDSDVLQSYAKFKPVAKQHFYNCNISTITTLTGWNSFKDNNSQSLIYVYNNYDQNSLSILNNVVCKKAIKASINTLIIDKNQLEEGVFAAICDTYSISVSETAIAILNFEELENKATNYLLDDGEYLREIVNRFLSE